jgi:hypothetical protein
MEGGDRGIELLGDLADGAGADRPAEDRQQRPADPRLRGGRLLRVEMPSTKQARIKRSTSAVRRA